MLCLASPFEAPSALSCKSPSRGSFRTSASSLGLCGIAVSKLIRARRAMPKPFRSDLGSGDIFGTSALPGRLPHDFTAGRG
jgi:hypothetical protein